MKTLRLSLLALAIISVLGCGQSPPPSRLQRSAAKGLYGAPLPVGVTLVEQLAGDPVTGRNSYQRYSIAASSSDIMAFFEQEMIATGWSRVESLDTRNSRSFQNRSGELVVMTNPDGRIIILTRP